MRRRDTFFFLPSYRDANTVCILQWEIAKFGAPDMKSGVKTIQSCTDIRLLRPIRCRPDHWLQSNPFHPRVSGVHGFEATRWYKVPSNSPSFLVLSFSRIYCRWCSQPRCENAPPTGHPLRLAIPNDARVGWGCKKGRSGISDRTGHLPRLRSDQS